MFVDDKAAERENLSLIGLILLGCIQDLKRPSPGLVDGLFNQSLNACNYFVLLVTGWFLIKYYR
jgi:hypothetical protein